MRFRTVLFDLDGTLVDHFAAIHRSHSHTRRHFGLPEPTPEQVRRAVGRGIENAIRDLLGPDHAHLLAEAHKVYREHWDRTMLDDVTVLPGALELLDALRQDGIRSAIVTNKHGPSARLLTSKVGFDDRVEAVFGAGDTPWLKPEPAYTRHILQALEAKAGETLFVGDSIYDVQTATQGGLPIWTVTTGTHSAEELEAAGAERIFAGLAELQVELFRG